MNGFHISKVTQVASWIVALIIVVLNGNWYMMKQGWLENSDNPIVLWLTVVPLALSFLVLLLYIVFLLLPNLEIRFTILHIIYSFVFTVRNVQQKKNIAVSVDFSNADEVALNSAELGGTAAKYTLIHVVETVGAMLYGENIDDHETLVDERLKDYQVMNEKDLMSQFSLVLTTR
jgi:manganese transport protein